MFSSDRFSCQCHVMSRMTNSPLAKLTWALRRWQQHKVVSVSLSAPQSLAFDLKGCCSQHRIKECIVPLYTDVIHLPSIPNYHIKESLHLEKHLGFVWLSHKTRISLSPVLTWDRPVPGFPASWPQEGRNPQMTGWQLCWLWWSHLGLGEGRHYLYLVHLPSCPECTWRPQCGQVTCRYWS